MRLLKALTPALLFVASIPAFAQYSVDKVVFQNAAPYSDAELLATSGLEAGQFLSHDSLVNAAQHLLDTGLFADAQVSLSGQGKGRTVLVELKPLPLADLLPVGLENFVWYTPEELYQGIHIRVPLYRGVAPETGNLQDAIQAALLAMVKQKGVDAKLSHDVPGPTVKHPRRVVEYRVDQPAIRLADVKLSLSAPPGAAAKLTPGFQAAVRQAIKSPFNEGLSGTTIEDLLLPPVRNFGYVTAHLDHIERSILPSTNDIAVTYTVRVVTGEAYTVSSITWDPTPIYTAEDFTRDAKLHTGDLASAYMLSQTETSIVAAYLNHGYMDAVAIAPPTLDDTAHSVAYALKVVPGEIYRIKTVTPLQLDPDAQKEFDANWRMKPGEPYSAKYVESFIQTNTALPHLAKYTASYQASADPQAHLVDLTITFVPSAH